MWGICSGQAGCEGIVKWVSNLDDFSECSTFSETRDSSFLNDALGSNCLIPMNSKHGVGKFKLMGCVLGLGLVVSVSDGVSFSVNCYITSPLEMIMAVRVNYS